jgi:hypothetical protein
LQGKGDVHKADHHGDLDQWANDRREGCPETQSEDSHIDSDGELKNVLFVDWRGASPFLL